MKAIKDIELFDLGLLIKPSVSIASVDYDWETNIASILLIIKEEGANFNHGRSVDLQTDGLAVTATDVENFIANYLGNDFE